ncbi:hypothetical protein JCM11251_001533 [Rhodosporidiobolus azoricus]
MLLDGALQSPVLSLFSSTSSHPTLLAQLQVSDSCASDSFISLLDDATDAHEQLLGWAGSSAADLEARSASLGQLRKNQDAHPGGEGIEVKMKDLASRALHLQGPDCRTTSAKWGSWEKGKWREEGLRIELPLMHIQLKDLGQTMYLDIGVLDEAGDLTVVRCSTWQTYPKVQAATPSHPRLLHLPLAFPSSSPSSHTTPLLSRWTTLALPLHTLLLSLPAPSPRFKAVLGVEIHATCRLRRIWFSAEGAAPNEVGEEELRRGIMPEMAMFAAA